MSIEEISAQVMCAILSNPLVFEAYSEFENKKEKVVSDAIEYAKELKNQLNTNKLKNTFEGNCDNIQKNIYEKN